MHFQLLLKRRRRKRNSSQPNWTGILAVIQWSIIQLLTCAKISGVSGSQSVVCGTSG